MHARKRFLTENWFRKFSLSNEHKPLNHIFSKIEIFDLKLVSEGGNTFNTVQPTVNKHHTKHSSISSDIPSQRVAVTMITIPILMLPIIISNFCRDCDGFFVPLLEPIKVLCLISFYCGGLRCWTYCLPDRQLCHGLHGTISKVPLPWCLWIARFSVQQLP